MSPFFELSNEIPDTDIFTKGAEVSEITKKLLDPDLVRFHVNIIF